VAIALASALSGVTAASSFGAFPGRNGVVGYESNGFDNSGPGSAHSRGIATVGPAGSPDRSLMRCTTSDWGYSEGDCSFDPYDDPSFSPDGRRIVFDGGTTLAVIPVAGGKARALPGQTTDDSQPAFSPDGRWIAFTGTAVDGSRDVYVMDSSGARLRRLTFGGGSEPAWSSRGRIAFTKGQWIYAMDKLGDRVSRIARGSDPDWSPHGSKLAFVRDRRVHAIALGDKRVTRVTHQEGLDPAWSPDGQAIAFVRPIRGIVRIRPDGRRPRMLVADQYGDSGGHFGSEPTWQPLR
jgi:Tol biopolymer transport system component